MERREDEGIHVLGHKVKNRLSTLYQRITATVTTNCVFGAYSCVFVTSATTYVRSTQRFAGLTHRAKLTGIIEPLNRVSCSRRRIVPKMHKVEQGDTIIKLSEHYGLFVHTIWNDPANADLRRLRPDMNMLMPGDEVTIPDKRPSEVNEPSGKRHRFRRKGIPAVYRVQIFRYEEPRANESYRFVVDGVVQAGTTDAEGVLQESLPAGARSAELFVGDDELPYEIAFGHMDPISEVSGIQKRLHNLGYDCGEPDNKLNDDTREALREFQKRFELDQTGEPDNKTVEHLEQVHDAPNDFPPETTKVDEQG